MNENQQEDTQPRLVVGIGASAGGLEAFKELLAVLPGDTGMAFLLVQHLDPTHESLLGELLAPHTAMAVRDADEGLRVARDTVYVIRPDTALAVRQGRIALSAPVLRRGVRLPADHLFRSLAAEYGTRSVGVVLTGAGSDGSAGLREIRAAGGLSLVQDPASSAQSGMPRSAVDAGAAELVLDIREMPGALERFADLPAGARLEPPRATSDNTPEAEPAAPLDEPDLGRLAALLEAGKGFDLTVYKRATLERRVLRRMALAGFVAFDPYLAHLREDAGEQQTLMRDLLIGVTEFFRDPEAFQALRSQVLDPLVAAAGAGETLRVWVPGCATGEEAYSIGMELLDAIAAQGKRLGLQIFATDVDQDALAFARAAVYPHAIAERVSGQRLGDYFTQLDAQGYQVRPPLRDAVSFAAHDVTRDPPFSRMHLVSCRNLLIYLTPDAQRQVLGMLHFALAPNGHLFLSTSESTGAQRELFSTVSKSHRIYAKLGASRQTQLVHRGGLPARGAPSEAGAAAPRSQPGRRLPAHDMARRAVLEAWAPPTVIVAEDGAVLFLHGALEPYLHFPQGDDPRLEINALLRPALATRARGAIHRARRSQAPVVVLWSPEGGGPARVRISARPVLALGDGAVMVSFESLADEARTQEEVAATQGMASDGLVEQLERELQATREDLRTTVDELEGANEALRASNEEATSMNEELQSANEELEATTEELRSLNEELTTVNAQLREKVEELEQAHDDLDNFFASTKVATVFLDEALRLKRFTPAAEQLLGIGPSAVGRHVSALPAELLQNGLDGDAAGVLDDLAPREREIHTGTGRWITRRVLPYRTESRRIEGVVATFADVTDLRAANEALTVKSRRLALAWDAARGGIYEHRVPLDASTDHSEEWARVLGYHRDDLPAWDELAEWLREQVHPDDRGRFEEAHAEFLEGRTPTFEAEARLRHRSGDWRWVKSIAKALERDDAGRVRHVLGMMIDISALKRVQEQLREAGRQKDEYLAVLGHELRNPVAAIASATDLLKLKGGDDPHLAHVQGVLARQTTHMSRLLDGLLDVSRIARGKITLDRQPVEMIAVCREAAADGARRLEGRPLALHSALPAEPLWVDGDPVRLKQILDNLLSNAIKFTPDGGRVELSLAREAERVVVQVCDTGQGIEPGLLPHVFEPFRQQAQPSDRSGSGLGIGLALVKSLTELHGGSVQAASDGVDRGTQVVIRLPAREPPADALSVDPEASGEPLRILLIEDNRDLAEALARSLELDGHQAAVAATGEEGVELARRIRPEAIVCDLGLPGDMDGYQVARTMRGDDRIRDVPMLALSGYGRPEDKARARDAGFDAHLTKPADQNALLTELRRIAARRTDGDRR